jgi:hypothetical protein
MATFEKPTFPGKSPTGHTDSRKSSILKSDCQFSLDQWQSIQVFFGWLERRSSVTLDLPMGRSLPLLVPGGLMTPPRPLTSRRPPRTQLALGSGRSPGGKPPHPRDSPMASTRRALTVAGPTGAVHRGHAIHTGTLDSFPLKLPRERIDHRPILPCGLPVKAHGGEEDFRNHGRVRP